jgi:putative chitinase
MTSSVILTAQQLAQATGARIDRAEARLDVYQHVCEVYQINTRLRMACFLPQVGVESGGFRYSREIWGPTPAQRRYEGRKDLGNVKPGDGRRFKGHGDIQNTGRHNHALMRDLLRLRFPDKGVPDFEAEPDKLAELPWAALSAGEFWVANDINRYADVANFDACCDEVNRGRATLEPGDTNGFEHRLNLFVAAMRSLP